MQKLIYAQCPKRMLRLLEGEDERIRIDALFERVEREMLGDTDSFS